MADMNSILARLVANQANHFEVANSLHDAASPAALFGRDESSSGPNAFGLYGGVVLVDGALVAVPSQTVLALPSVAGEWLIEAGLVDSATVAITAITQDTAAVVTAPGHEFAVGHHVYFSAAVGGMTWLRQAFARVVEVDGDAVTIDWDTNDFPAYTSGGTLALAGVTGTMKVGKARGAFHGPCFPCYVVTMAAGGIDDWEDVRTNRAPDSGWQTIAVPDNDDTALDGRHALSGFVRFTNGGLTTARRVWIPYGRPVWQFVNVSGNTVQLQLGASTINIFSGDWAMVAVLPGDILVKVVLAD